MRNSFREFCVVILTIVPHAPGGAPPRMKMHVGATGRSPVPRTVNHVRATCRSPLHTCGRKEFSEKTPRRQPVGIYVQLSCTLGELSYGENHSISKFGRCIEPAGNC